jgi:hypothetical protein
MPRQGGYSVQHTGQARAAGQVKQILKSGLATLEKERATCVYFPTTPGPLSYHKRLHVAKQSYKRCNQQI